MIQTVLAQVGDTVLRPRSSAAPGAGAGTRANSAGGMRGEEGAGRRALYHGKPAMRLRRINHFPHAAPVNRSLSM